MNETSSPLERFILERLEAAVRDTGAADEEAATRRRRYLDIHQA